MVNKQFQQLLTQTFEIVIDVLGIGDGQLCFCLERCLTDALGYWRCRLRVGHNPINLLLVEYIGVDVILKHKYVARRGLQMDGSLAVCQNRRGHMLLLRHLTEIVELFIVGYTYFLTQDVAHLVERARELTLQLDVATQTGNRPLVVLDLGDFAHGILYFNRHESKVVLVVIDELAD